MVYASNEHRGRQMPTCTNCGEFITPDFVRVFGDNENQVQGCPACLTATDICDGETVPVASRSW